MILLTAVLVQTATRLLPVDEAGRDPSFLRFRSGLIRAIDRNDHAAVFRAVAPNIQLGFGGVDGIANFRRQWTRYRSYRAQLRHVLSHGGAWLKEEKVKPMFQAPYYSARFPEKYEPFVFGAILGRRVPLKARPDTRSRTLQTLSYDIVRSGNQPFKGGWLRIVTLKGVAGYVPERMYGRPEGYRAGFRKVGGRWKMVYFLAGD